MIKKKICKSGTGKAKGYEGCGKEYYLKNGLCRKCYAKWYFSTEEGEKRIMNAARKRIVKEEKKVNKEHKLECKSIRGLIVEAKVPFQKLIRIRDYRKNCICCDKLLPFELGGYDAGHFKKAEIYSGLIFHPDNVHGQRKYCNDHMDGNEANYAEGLKNRIGIVRFNNLLKLSIELKNYKWSRQQLIDLKKHYQSELRKIESGEKNVNDIDFSVGILNINQL